MVSTFAKMKNDYFDHYDFYVGGNGYEPSPEKIERRKGSAVKEKFEEGSKYNQFSGFDTFVGERQRPLTGKVDYGNGRGTSKSRIKEISDTNIVFGNMGKD